MFALVIRSLFNIKINHFKYITKRKRKKNQMILAFDKIQHHSLKTFTSLGIERRFLNPTMHIYKILLLTPDHGKYLTLSPRYWDQEVPSLSPLLVSVVLGIVAHKISEDPQRMKRY